MFSIKKVANLKKIILISTISVFTLALIFFLYSLFVIYKDVKISCLKAQKEYKENCVNSLTRLVQSNEKTFRERNTAIWVLGQLADSQALPVLNSYYTGIVPSKEALDKSLSQYELKKAIKWCEQGNITSWMYRNRESWH